MGLTEGFEQEMICGQTERWRQVFLTQKTNMHSSRIRQGKGHDKSSVDFLVDVQ
jgi:hypothetical protein